MKTALLVSAFLLLATAAVLAAPPAEARQACVYGGGDPCDDHLVCVWDRLNGEWACFVGVYPPPCDPTRCDPW